MKVLFIDSAHPILHETLSEKGFDCDLSYELTKQEISDTIHLYQGIVIRSKIKLDQELLDKAINLKFIARVGAGMENIDVAYAESKGIKCFHAPEGNRDAVAEHALGMLLGLMNNLFRADEEVRKGQWNREQNRGEELGGKTVGILGYGNMGEAFATRLTGFGVKVLAYDKYRNGFGSKLVREVDLVTLFEESDILSIHLPLTDETEFMVNAKFLDSFKKKIRIINTARGKVLKTSDLIERIKSGKVIGACLDVLEYEDLSFEGIKDVLSNKNSPEIQYLLNSDKIVLSPHIAGWTMESNAKLASVLASKITAEFTASK